MYIICLLSPFLFTLIFNCPAAATTECDQKSADQGQLQALIDCAQFRFEEDDKELRG